MNNLVMCKNRVNTHSHRAYFTNYFLNIKELAKSILGTLTPDNRRFQQVYNVPFGNAVFISVDSIQKESNKIEFSNFRNPKT